MRRRTFRRRFKRNYSRKRAAGRYRKRRGTKTRYNLNSRGGVRL